MSNHHRWVFVFIVFMPINFVYFSLQCMCTLRKWKVILLKIILSALYLLYLVLSIRLPHFKISTRLWECVRGARGEEGKVVPLPFREVMFAIYVCYVGSFYLLGISLDEVLGVNNKRNQLKIKGIKVYSTKQIDDKFW